MATRLCASPQLTASRQWEVVISANDVTLTQGDYFGILTGFWFAFRVFTIVRLSFRARRAEKHGEHV